MLIELSSHVTVQVPRRVYDWLAAKSDISLRVQAKVWQVLLACCVLKRALFSSRAD